MFSSFHTENPVALSNLRPSSPYHILVAAGTQSATNRSSRRSHILSQCQHLQACRLTNTGRSPHVVHPTSHHIPRASTLAMSHPSNRLHSLRHLSHVTVQRFFAERPDTPCSVPRFLSNRQRRVTEWFLFPPCVAVPATAFPYHLSQPPITTGEDQPTGCLIHPIS